ncbi:hypothetical protein [Ornithinimicrobium cavernae]|uniref:hypothetical protein n=1 Tax=Ornithinimicrobium cavernae TaxID=2666047 RepID=UPI000D68E29C|nr:hypothetical protein [Ornithinimicrobium cavernae]
MKKIVRSMAVAGVVGVAALSGTAANAVGGDAAPTAKVGYTTVSYGSMEACYWDVPWMWFSGYDLVRGFHASGGTVKSVWRYNTSGW